MHKPAFRCAPVIVQLDKLAVDEFLSLACSVWPNVLFSCTLKQGWSGGGILTFLLPSSLTDRVFAVEVVSSLQ